MARRIIAQTDWYAGLKEGVQALIVLLLFNVDVLLDVLLSLGMGDLG